MKAPSISTLEDVVAVRPCGGCTACCAVVPVAEIEKRAFQRCPKLRDIFDARGPGCSVYHKPGFPLSCDRWSCVWATSYPEDMPEEARPDRCGVVIDPIIDLCREVATGREIPSAQMWVIPGYENAFEDSKVVLDLIYTLLQRVEVVMWRLPYKPGEPPRGRTFNMNSDGRIACGPVVELTMNMDERERFARVDQIITGGKPI